MNMLTRWVPGDILVAVGDGGVLALDGSAQAMEAMWTELGEHRCLGDLLKSLSRLHDNEVFTLPDFLMMAIDGQELRVAARGRFCLHLDTADGERSFSASEVVVWEESRYERVNQCILELAPAAGCGGQRNGPGGAVGPAGGGGAAGNQHLAVREGDQEVFEPTGFRGGVVVEEDDHLRVGEPDRRVPAPGQAPSVGVRDDVDERTREFTGLGQEFVVVVDDHEHPALAPGFPELTGGLQHPVVQVRPAVQRVCADDNSDAFRGVGVVARR